MRSTWPVTGFESSDARNTTAGAELPGFIAVNSVVLLGVLDLDACMAWPTMRVTPPGPMQLARTP